MRAIASWLSERTYPRLRQTNMASEAEIVVIRRVGQLDGPEDHTHYRQSLDIRQDSLEARTAFRRETMAFKFENVALRPLSQLGGTEPNGRYSPSLEAQGDGPEVRSGLRRWIQALYGARMVPDDVVEEQLRIAIEESGPEVYDPETGNRMNKERHQLRYLLNDYERFKHRMDTRVCRDMFRCYTLTDGTHNGGVQSTTLSLLCILALTTSIKVTSRSRRQKDSPHSLKLQQR
jgi:hypothetical protein